MDVLVGEVQVSDGLQVLWMGEAPLLFEATNGFGDQVCGQKHHGGSAETQTLLLRRDPFQLQSGIQSTAEA